MFTEMVDVSYVFFAGNGLLVLAVLDSGTMYTMSSLSVCVGLCLVSIGICTIVSAVYHVGPKALAGADHFYPAEYRQEEKLVTKGVYEYMSHPLYKLGMLLEWGVAVAAGSRLCLILALSAHVSALSFMYGTEIPDMRVIYGNELLNNNKNNNKKYE
jgi:protein-S-isoprenylcysteine O-methyltransferase Ste14